MTVGQRREPNGPHPDNFHDEHSVPTHRPQNPSRTVVPNGIEGISGRAKPPGHAEASKPLRVSAAMSRVSRPSQARMATGNGLRAFGLSGRYRRQATAFVMKRSPSRSRASATAFQEDITGRAPERLSLDDLLGAGRFTDEDDAARGVAA